ncbi:MAG TPA: class I SAM-dependent methyltransferase [Bacillota bacterium]|nr:class I SAM-dependent methyltransferase [Bacillota bacterium]HPZ55508.1 class I SAM-dependent methyltransferase [Bacillota bacterium]HQD18195.1 class I SAM-dependent methyltransferase [Bacillota bacterium]
MFSEMPEAVLARMRYLEEIDRVDRVDGTSRMKRLRQVTPVTGRFVTLMASIAPPGTYIEIGISADYSTLWLGLACKQLGRRLITYEILPDKVAMARETLVSTQFDSFVELVHGDAREHLADLQDVAFCFLDAEKEIYRDCYDLVMPRMVSGALLVADNAINHRDTLQPMIDYALVDDRVDAMVVGIEKGVLVCRKK